MWGFLVDITYIHEYTLCLLYILHMCIHLTLLFTVCAYSTCTLHMYTVINYPKCCDRHEQVQWQKTNYQWWEHNESLAGRSLRIFLALGKVAEGVLKSLCCPALSTDSLSWNNGKAQSCVLCGWPNAHGCNHRVNTPTWSFDKELKRLAQILVKCGRHFIHKPMFWPCCEEREKKYLWPQRSESNWVE